tara:strand:+ start:201 stop:428 length:228 start_codon:yes stop_codon:yes gene_type:complete
VGQSFAPLPVEFPVVAASVSESPPFAFEFGLFREPEAFASPAVAVGQSFAAHVSRLRVPLLGRLWGTCPSFWEEP